MMLRPPPSGDQGAGWTLNMKILDRLQLGSRLVDVILSDSNEVEINVYPANSSSDYQSVYDYCKAEGIIERALENACMCRTHPDPEP